MKKNQKIKGTAEDLSREGYGVVRHDGEVIFVKDLLPGEEAEIKIILAKKSFAVGIVEKRLTTSPSRNAPRCSKASQCGGCQLQSLRYEDQLKYKHNWMSQLFHSRVGEDLEVRPVIGSDNPWQYRNKAQFPVQTDGETVKIGFYRPRTNEIVETESCAIQDPQINEVYRWFQKQLTPQNAQGLRHVLVRTGKDGALQVVLIGRNEKQARSFTEGLKEAFPNLQSVVFNRNERKDNVILGDEYKVLYGTDWIPEENMGNVVRLHFKSFFQVNDEMTRKLYQQALEAADLSGNETVIDMYSGTGTIGMMVAPHAKEVIGVEIVPEAVENARANADLNGLTNCEFLCEDATVFASNFSQAGKHADVVIVDPPRKGLTGQGIEDISVIGPDRIIYVSCNPETLARDIRLFEEQGYSPEFVQPVDMFPQTVHVENVCLLTKQPD